jgi:Family of unknown function (DUF6311)
VISRDTPTLLAAALLGLAGFLIYCGWSLLIPTNIAWLDFGDRAMHQLGWMMYRDGPWSLPPGTNPNLGLELSNSIALVDGLPLFAIPFKLVEHWLPRPFQYWGYWLLLCFMLQAMFATLLARTLGAGHLASLVAAGFAIATPAFLFRVPMHMALSGHWVLLAALWLFAKSPAPARWAWPLLIATTAAIHATLLATVSALWLFAILQRLLLARNWPALLVETSLVIGSALATLWTVGFFVPADLGTYGYGDYKLNLLALFNPYDWSRLLPELPHLKYDYEGLSFLGIGVLALLIAAVFSGAALRLRAVIQRRWWPLALTLLGLTVFALSQKVTFGDHDLFTIAYPKLIESIGSAFRSTGRFVWPLVYFVTIGSVALLATRLKPIALAAVAGLALAAQLCDSAPQAAKFQASLPPPASTWTTPLVSSFWDRAADAGYNRIRAIPAYAKSPDWSALSYYAVTHAMSTDAVQLGRTSRAALTALRRLGDEALATGAFEPYTLYVLDREAATAARRWLLPDDLITIIDDRLVFARGGAHLLDGLGIPPQMSVAN